MNPTIEESDEAPKCSVTHSDVFGTSSDDELQHEEEAGSDGNKGKKKRVRLSAEEKIEIVQHSQKNPRLTQKDLIEWSHHKFGRESFFQREPCRKYFSRRRLC